MKLNPLFCDGMVLQAGKPIRIFGTGGGAASVEFLGSRAEGVFTATKWVLELPAAQYGGPYEMKVTLSGRERIIRDIYIGDVYLISGQSNMQFKLRESEVPAEQYRSHPLVRLFSTECMAGGESFFPEDGWVKCDRSIAGNWSCIGYLMGDILSEKRDTAVGLVTCYQGAAAIQCFLPRDVFEADPSLVVPQEIRYDRKYVWNVGTSIFYEYMFSTLIPFSFAAVVFYQGESNASLQESEIYGRMLRLMIERWRRDLLDGDLRFVIIQIADYKPRLGQAWSNIQNAQTEMASLLPNVFTVESRDVCETDNIHPKKKTVLTQRVVEALLR